jgi:D-aminoacyl-tRNA deacylase
MRAVIQRASKGRVSVEGHVLGEIDLGLVILLGVGHGDGQAEADRLADKIASLPMPRAKRTSLSSTYPVRYS